MKTEKKRLLFIEDDIIDQKAFIRFANQLEFPFDYDISDSVKETKKILESNKYDVILADYTLGDGNAFDILKVVVDTPMVIVTGTGDEEIAVKAMKLGAYDYLLKDVQGNYLKMITVTVENAIKHFNAEHRLQEYHKNLEKLVEERTAKLNMEIVERKQAEEELRLYEIVVSNSTDMLAVLNREYTYLAANSSYREVFKLTSEELIGRTVTEIFGKEFFETVIKPEADQCMNGIEVHYQEWFDFPAFKNKRYMEITYYPYNDKDNKMLGFVVNGRNVTDRKRAEDELKESEEKYRNLFNQVSDAVYVIDGETGRVLDANNTACKMYGYTHEEWIKMKNTDVSAEPAKTDNATKETPDTIPVRYHKKKDGTVFPLEMTLNTFELKGRRTIIASARDITERMQSEKSIKESEKKYRRLVESLEHDYIIYSRDTQGVFTYLSPSIVNVLGYTKDEFIGHYTEYITDSPVNNKVEQYTEAALRGEKQPFYEAEFWHKDGSRRHLEVMVVPVFDIEGKVLGIEGIVHDITERKQAEKVVRDSESRLKEAQQIAHIGSWELDLITNKLYWSDEVYSIFNLEPHEIVKTYELFLDSVHPEDKEMVNKAFKESVKNNIPYDIVHRILLKDGSIKFVNERCETYYDETGKAIRSVGTVQDISNRVKAEEDLSTERNKLKVIMDAIVDGIYIVNKQFDIEYINPAIEREFGSVKVQKCYEYFHDRKEVCSWCKNEEVFEGKSLRGEWYSSKNKRDYDLFETAIINANGSMSKMKIFHDITELKKIEKELKKYQDHLEELVEDRTNELEAFTYSVSHDLRSPLRAISGFSEILSDEYKDKLDDEAKRLINVISKNARNMNQLISDLLDFSRIGRQEVRSVEIDMKELAHEIFDELMQISPERNIEFKIGKIPSANGDRILMHHVFTNLILNAIKFTSHKSIAEIEIGFVEKDKKLFYYIKDNGVGFDMKYADKIFEVFQRLHSPAEFEGTGVGLAIVQKIIQKHGGQVMAEGEVDKGATFYFSLPIIENS